ncbi:MAG: glycosyltransferase family 39 protein [Pseudomonadota bacterium]
MTFPEDSRKAALPLCLLLGLLVYALADTTHRPVHDEVRYADYAVGLQSGVFGVSFGAEHTPGYANVPLYPLFVAFHMLLSDALAASLDCVVKRSPRFDCPVFGSVCGPPERSDCDTQLGVLVAGQALLFSIALYLCYHLTLAMTDNQGLALLSIPSLFLAMHFVSFVEQIMTENLVLPLVTGLLLSLVNWLKAGANRWLASAGVLLGLLMLTRPEYLYLVVALLPFVFWRAPGRRLRSALVLLLCAALVVSPWIYRNQKLSGTPALVDDSYSGIVLSERVAFNTMTPAEWFGGLIYWLPDFGDELAPLVLPASAYQRYQEFRPESFSTLAATRIYPRALAAGGDGMTGWLIRQEVLPNLHRHVMTTLPLLWRGLFIGKYWGIVGFIGLALLLCSRFGSAPALWLGLLLIPVFLLCLRAGVSVNMPRYSVPLMPLYAMGWAHLLASVPGRKATNAGP